MITGEAPTFILKFLQFNHIRLAIKIVGEVTSLRYLSHRAVVLLYFAMKKYSQFSEKIFALCRPLCYTQIRA